MRVFRQRPQPLSDPLCYIWRKRFEFTLAERLMTTV